MPYDKHLIKSSIVIALILGFALISTYVIYYRFKDTNNQVDNSTAFKVTYYEKEGDQVTLTKVAPITDAVGYSTHAYTFTVENNLDKKIKYRIQLTKNVEKIEEENCGEYQIPLSIIKGAIHRSNSGNKVFMLSELKDNTILTDTLNKEEKVTYTLRVWTTPSSLPLDSNLHYHGKIKIEEVAIAS